MARFEVLGLDAYRDLIRSLAKRLAEDDPDAAQIRATVSRTIAANRCGSEAYSLGCAVRLWLGPTSISLVRVNPVARSTCDSLPSRYKHHPQRHEAAPFFDPAHVDGGAG